VQVNFCYQWNQNFTYLRIILRCDFMEFDDNSKENRLDFESQSLIIYLIRSLLKAPTWREAQWIVEQHQVELLQDPSVDTLLQSLAVNQKNVRTQRLLEEIRAVLSRCREVSIEQAFEEKIYAVISQEPERIRQQLDFDSINISADQAVQLLTAMVTQNIDTLWRTHPELVGIATDQETLMALLRRYPDLSVILGLPSSEFAILEEGEPIETPPEFLQALFQVQRLEDEISRNPDPQAILFLIQVYQQILGRLKSEKYQLFKASTLLNLGATYLQLPIGDRLYNIRQAINSCKEALSLWNSDSTPINYGLTLSTLGSAYSELPSTLSEFGDNLMQSINYFRKALKFLTPEIAARGYASTQLNLGETYRNLPGGLEENLNQAIECYKKALRVYKPETAPLKYALTQNDLGIAYGQLPTDRQKNLKEAIECFKKALRFRTPALPFDYAQTLHNLGVAYSELPERSSEDLTQAVNYLQEALKFRTPKIAPFGCRMTAMLLGDLYCKQEEWYLAHHAYNLARMAAEELYHSAFIPITQKGEIETNTALYNRLVNICLQLRDDPVFARNALVYAEGGKARTFLDQMGQGDFPSPPGVPEDRLKREKELIKRLRKKEQTLLASHLSIEQIEQYARERQDIEDELEEFWDSLIREHPTAQEYVNLRRAKSPTWDELIQLANNLGGNVALVEFYTLEDKIAAFILRSGWDAPLIFVLPISQQVFLKRHYRFYKEDVRQRKERSTPKYHWLKLGEDLLTPLESALESVQLVYFVPHNLLHVMPLHALTVQGEPFICRYAVAYAPSLAVLARSLQTVPETQAGTSALVMGYEPEKNPVFLEEAEVIAKLFGSHPWLDKAANTPTLRRYALDASYIHLSCHGKFKQPASLDSCVQLADDNFTARQWMELQLKANLVTLSACETGLSDVGRGDEIVGLTSALLYAGASSVLLTLWSVVGPTTKEWMLDFYKRAWSNKTGKLKAKAFAFQEATLALRKQHPDPFLWAPFILVGDWR
jgi:CHAT domain-containing protein